MSSFHNKFFDFAKLAIWGDAPTEGEGTKQPQLIFGLRDGNPRITVYTGITGPNGVIAFPSDYPTMVGVLQLLKDVVKGKPGEERYAISSIGAVWENNKPTKEKKVVAMLHIGKSKDGLIYFSVIAENKPKIVFTVKPSPFHQFTDGAKNPVPDSMISERIASGLADLVLNLISHALLRYSEESYTSGARKQLEVKSTTHSNTTPGAGSAAIKPELMQDLDDLAL